MLEAATAGRIWALDAPLITLPTSFVMLGGSDAPLTMPCPSYLIEHQHGLAVFDTSLASDAFDEPAGVYGELAEIMGMDLRPEQRLDRQIESLGFQLADVTHVVLSHTHFDHTGGLHFFPDAKFYVGEGEFNYAFHPPGPVAPFIREEDLARVRGCQWYEIPRCDIDLFGDGVIKILFTPGHTPGHLSLSVARPDGRLILTADAAHIRAQLQNHAPMPYDADVEQAARTLKKLQLLGDQPGTTLWISHDPEDWAEHARD